MVAKNKSPHLRPAPRRIAAAVRADAIELFAQKMRAVHQRDKALADVVRLRDAGKVLEAKAQLKVAETLHARIEAFDREFASHRTAGR